ncbi:hypothetical protein LNP74_26315 [Klebsiella pneumoniae subsp. pneumoniae]|nr:hypothetical protein [Klebsiella pneumoniae subsp. pneumoniae]
MVRFPADFCAIWITIETAPLQLLCLDGRNSNSANRRQLSATDCEKLSAGSCWRVKRSRTTKRAGGAQTGTTPNLDYKWFVVPSLYRHDHYHRGGDDRHLAVGGLASAEQGTP